MARRYVVRVERPLVEYLEFQIRTTDKGSAIAQALHEANNRAGEAWLRDPEKIQAPKLATSRRT